MTINERLLSESQFMASVREKYPNGPPRVKVGTKVMTVYGPGVVVGEEELYKRFYPAVEYASPPLHATGEHFNSRVLRLFPYEFDFAVEDSKGSTDNSLMELWRSRIEQVHGVAIRQIVAG